METCELPLVTALAVPVGTTVSHPKKIVFDQGTEVPGCLELFVDYTQGVPGRILTITLVFGTANGDLYTIVASGASTTLTTAGKSVILVGISGGPRIVTFNFASAGGAGVDDVVTCKISGLPTTGVSIV